MTEPSSPAKRDRFLRCWLQPHQRTGLALIESGSVLGYGVIRACRSGCKIGPLFASTPDGADVLFRALAATAEGAEVFWTALSQTAQPSPWRPGTASCLSLRPLECTGDKLLIFGYPRSTALPLLSSGERGAVKVRRHRGDGDPLLWGCGLGGLRGLPS
jgi:hypothetical protein